MYPVFRFLTAAFSHYFQSLVTGRPPSLLTSCIDCRIPTVEDENAFQEEEIPIGCVFYLSTLSVNNDEC